MKFNLHTSRKFSSAVAAWKKESKIKTYEFILGDCLENLKKIVVAGLPPTLEIM